MNLILKLRNLATKILGQKNALLTYDIDRQIRFLSSFSEPQDDMERSYNQYRCQMKLYGLFYELMVNLVAPFLSIVYLLQYANKNASYKHTNSHNDQKDRSSRAIFFTNTLSDQYLPDELIREFPTMIHVELTDHCGLSKEDIVYFKEICRKYPLSWYFQLKILLKIGVYSKQIDLYKPDAIIVSAEYSFTSSIMTNYCNKKGILHINIQHGEKMLYMEDAFFRFDKCFLWDEVYKDILVRLKGEPSQFQISIPPILTAIKEKIISSRDQSIHSFDVKYYLASETRSDLVAIKNTLENIKKTGKTVCIRPHPTYTDRKLVKTIYKDDYVVEDPKLVSIEKSLAGCKVAVSLRSFVLQQAYYGGVETAIDDVSLPGYYKILEKVEYIMIKKSYKLSQLIKKENW